MGIASTRTHLGEQFSEGARRLWAEMDRRGWSQGQIAKAIDAKPGVVPRWLYGDTKPSWDWAVKLRDTFGIALEAWTVPPSCAFIPPAARAADESGEHSAIDPDATGTG
jgi:DNA-binding XRE family transcriptional regulator